MVILRVFMGLDHEKMEKGEGFSASYEYRASKYVTAAGTLFLVDSIKAVDQGFNSVQLDIVIKY
jgi:hypothetical protein